MTAYDFTIVILAAGASTRLGRPKQLVEMGGQTLLARAVATARAAVTPVRGAPDAPSSAPPREVDVVVVTGAAPERVATETARLAVATAPNPDWALGLGASVRAGVLAAQTRAGAAAPRRGIVLMLCDQPLLGPDHLRALMTAAAANGCAAASAYPDGSLGVPAAFAPALVPELLELAPTQGAKPVLARHAARTAAVPFPDGTLDVDTEADVARLAAVLTAPTVL
jgi:molybdenum cofactor cytidylyltransferase